MTRKFNPTTDIPNLTGRVCLVTGGNSGLGEATIAALAQHGPGKIYLGARSRSKAEAAMERIRATSKAASYANIEFLDLDLASFASIEAAAARVNSEADRLDLLHLNGGIGMTPPATTKEGYELQFGTNYLGHALLTFLLLPKLLATAEIPGADVRVVSISSIGHRKIAPAGGIIFDKLKTDMNEIGGPELYGQSMLAKIIFARELATRYPQITSTSLHPGGVRTNVWNGPKDVNWFVANVVLKYVIPLITMSPEEGAKSQLWCSFSKDVKSGSYYEPIGKAGKEGEFARDEKLSARLWEWTEKELQGHVAPR